MNEEHLKKIQSMKTAEEIMDYVKKEKVKLSSEEMEAISGGGIIPSGMYVNCKSCGTRFCCLLANCPNCGVPGPLHDLVG